MSRRGENIYKRKDGRWEGRYIKNRLANNKIQYGYIYSPSYKETKEKLLIKKFEYREFQKKEGEHYYPGSMKDYCYFQLDQWKETVKPSTYNTYRYKLEKYVLPFIGQKRLTEVKRTHIQRLVRHWRDARLATQTIQLIYQLLHRILGEAYTQKLAPRNPCVGVAIPKLDKKKVAPLSLTEQRQLERAAKYEKNGEAVLLALHTGLRIGEIAALKWENIDFDRKLLYVKETYQRISTPSVYEKADKTILSLGSAKTQSSKRIIPLTSAISHLLKGLVKNSPYVFQVNGKPIEPRLLTYYFHKIRAKAGLTKIHFHQLRHTFATRLLEARGTISSISELLGHSSTQTTLDVYTGTVFDEKHRSLEEMERLV